MGKHNFGYFLHEGVSNMFSHGFRSFAAIGVTVACLLIMGTFSLVAVNADANLKDMESENEILAFVDDSCTPAETQALQEELRAIDNVTSVEYISREDAAKSFEEQYPDEEMFQDLDPEIFRDRYAIHIADLRQISETKTAIEAVPGVADTRAEEQIAGGFITLRNVATVVCVALILILFMVSIFIISNTIKLTTFDRRDEIAVMKMVGATNGFIRWPFVYEGLLLGALSAVIAFGLQWLLYMAVAKGIASSDSLQILHVVPFTDIWYFVALVFLGAGVLVGVGGSLTAIRKFLRV